MVNYLGGQCGAKVMVGTYHMEIPVPYRTRGESNYWRINGVAVILRCLVSARIYVRKSMSLGGMGNRIFGPFRPATLRQQRRDAMANIFFTFQHVAVERLVMS